MKAKMRPRVQTTWIGKGEDRRQKHTQAMHIVDDEGETMFVFSVEVPDAEGLKPGLYDFTEASFAVGDWQAPMFSRDLAGSLVPAAAVGAAKFPKAS